MVPNTNLKDIMTKTQTTDFFIACKESRIESNTSFYGCFYLGPFDESLSQTLANDLRRTLLSELTGLAITSVEIEGVLHKFSSLPGMKESVLDLICNLQNIIFKKQEISSDSSSLSFKSLKNQKSNSAVYSNSDHKNQPYNQLKRPTKKTYTGFLNVNGPRVIKAMDLKLPAGLQCVDPNQYIATLAEDGMLNMKFNINEGKNFIKQKPHNLDVTVLKKRNILLQNFKRKINLGVSPLATNPVFNNGVNSVQNKNKKLSISNPIPLDAVFMPVTKINIIIEENNIYSDFSTDSVNLLDQTSSTTSNQINTKTSWSFFNFIDSNSIYQTSLLFKNKNKNIFGRGKNSIGHGLDTSFGGNTDGGLAVDDVSIVENKVKLIPWHSNSLYFNLSDNVTPLTTNNVSKIKTFLGSKPSLTLKSNVAVPSVPPKDVIQRNAQLDSLKIQENEIQKLSGSVSKNIKTVLKEHAKSFRVNTVSGLNQQTINLEYAKILKLKPLRKKSHLILEIWTNGSIHPRQALYQCFTFLSNNFLKLQTVKMIGSMFKSELAYGNIKYSYVNNYDSVSDPSITKSSNAGSDVKPNIHQLIPSEAMLQQTISKKVLVKTKELENTLLTNESNSIYQASLKAPIGILKLSLRSYTALKKAGIFTLKDLLNNSQTDLLKIKNVGTKSLYEIETSLADLGLTLKNIE